MYFAIKVLITALIVAGISELSRKFSLMAALLASLPITTVLAFIWIYAENKDTTKIAAMSYEVFWLVLPSLAFFLILPVLLKMDFKFPIALLIASAGTAILYGGMLYLLKVVK